MTDTVTMLGGRAAARRMRPTLAHRLAISPGILGTVYAVNDALEARYFDYDWDAAVAFAGITPGRDPRLAIPRARYAVAAGATPYVKSGCAEANPRRTTRCVWILKEDK